MDLSYHHEFLTHDEHVDEVVSNDDCHLGVGAVMPNDFSVNEINDFSHPMHVNELLSSTK